MWALIFVAGALAQETWYDDVDQDGLGGNDFDQDGDGHASIVEIARYATAHAGWSYEASWSSTTSPLPPDDCDDLLATVHPGAPDVCQPIGTPQVDEDCDGSASRLGAPERCNGLDDDCDLLIDEPDRSGVATVGGAPAWLDNDRDGFGDPSSEVIDVCPGWRTEPECEGGVLVPGSSSCWAMNADDCNDADASLHPYRVDRPVGMLLDRRDNGCEGRLPLAEIDADLDGSLPVPGNAPAAVGGGAYEGPADLALAPCDPDAVAPTLRVHGIDIVPVCDRDTLLWFVDTAPFELQGTVVGGTVLSDLSPFRDFNDCDDQASWRGGGTPNVETCDLTDTSCNRAFEGYADTDGIPDPMVAPLPGYTTETAIDVDGDGDLDACDPDGDGRWTTDEPTSIDLYLPDTDGDSDTDTGATAPAACGCAQTGGGSGEALLLAGAWCVAGRRRRPGRPTHLCGA